MGYGKTGSSSTCPLGENEDDDIHICSLHAQLHLSSVRRYSAGKV